MRETDPRPDRPATTAGAAAELAQRLHATADKQVRAAAVPRPWSRRLRPAATGASSAPGPVARVRLRDLAMQASVSRPAVCCKRPRSDARRDGPARSRSWAGACQPTTSHRSWRTTPRSIQAAASLQAARSGSHDTSLRGRRTASDRRRASEPGRSGCSARAGGSDSFGRAGCADACRGHAKVDPAATSAVREAAHSRRHLRTCWRTARSVPASPSKATVAGTTKAAAAAGRARAAEPELAVKPEHADRAADLGVPRAADPDACWRFWASGPARSRRFGTETAALGRELGDFGETCEPLSDLRYP